MKYLWQDDEYEDLIDFSFGTLFCEVEYSGPENNYVKLTKKETKKLFLAMYEYYKSRGELPE